MTTIIVGAGIAGLYTAYRLMGRVDNIHIYEASDRIGGRIQEVRFNNYNAPMGASMIRLGDINVIQLCEELHLELKKVDATLTSKESDFINDMIEKIINKYSSSDIPKDMSVLEFLSMNFSSEEVRRYVEYSIYRDYLYSSIHEYILHYPITDHIQEQLSGFVVKGGYSRLIDALYNAIKDKVVIHLSTPIVRTTKHYVITNQGRQYYNRLFWTLTEENKHIIRDRIDNDKLLSNIFGVPFLTMYAKVDSATKYPSVVVGGLLGKMYALGKNILMVAYTDGEAAIQLYKRINKKDKTLVINDIQSMVRQNAGFEDVVIQDLIFKYWPVGIHQYSASQTRGVSYKKFVKKNPRQNYDKVSLIGESISRNQGWVEGAIETVNNVVPQ